MTPDCSHTLQFVTVIVNWSFLVRGLIDAGNVMTTGQPSMHFAAVRAVVQNQTEVVMQTTDTSQHLRRLTACMICAMKVGSLRKRWIVSEPS